MAASGTSHTPLRATHTPTSASFVQIAIDHASRVAGAARAIEISDVAQVNKLAAILGFDGEVGPVEAAPASEPPAVGRLAMAADIAQIYNEMLVSLVEEVTAACCES